MSQHDDACPNSEELRSFLAGRLDVRRTDQLAVHLETCAACQQVIEQFDEGDASVDRIVDRDGNFEFADESQCGHALDAIADNGPVAVAIQASRQMGDYELGEPLGQGGMGTVYRARHISMGTTAAVKILQPHRQADQMTIDRFQREMVALGRLDHPNIVRALDAGEDAGQHYLVMEYVDGIDLGRIVKSQGSLTVADAAEVIRQAALGLSYVHRHGRVHRDIKPSNLILAKDGTVKLLDLGLARVEEYPMEETVADADDILGGSTVDLTRTHQVMGTLEYMPPEQATDSHKVDHRADLYSLGCTLYKLLTGHSPFASNKSITAISQLMAHVQTPARPVCEQREDVPQELSDLLDRMLAKKAQDRPQSADEVAEALAAFASGADLKSIAKASEQTQAFTSATEATLDAGSTKRIEPATASLATQQSRNSQARWLAAAAVVLLLIVATPMLRSRFFPPMGTVIVQLDSPEVAELLASSRARLVAGDRSYPLTPGQVELPADAYTTATSDAFSSLVFSPASLDLRGNQQIVVSVSLAPNPVSASSQSTKPITEPTAIVIKGAIELDGLRDFVTTSIHHDGKQPITLEAWVRPDNLSDHREVICNAQSAGMVLGFYNGICKFLVHDGKGYQEVAAQTPSIGNQWIHIAGVFDGRRLSLFVNGKNQGTETVPFASGNPSQLPFLIGANPSDRNPPIKYFSGLIDDVRFSKTARYQTDFVPQRQLASDSDSLAVYHFDEGSGEIAKDSSGNSFDAFISRGSHWIDEQGGKTQISPDRFSYEPVDLIPLIDPLRDVRGEDWKRVEGSLVSKPGHHTALIIPYVPPHAYRLEFTATRQIKDNALSIGLACGDKRITIQLDASPQRGGHSGLSFVDGRWMSARSVGVYHGQVLPMEQPVDVQITARRHERRIEIECTVGTKQIIAWRGHISQVEEHPGARFPSVPNNGVLYLSTVDTSIRLDDLRVVPLSDGGKVVEFTDASKNLSRAAAERAIWKGGVVSFVNERNSPDEVSTLPMIRVDSLAYLPASPRILKIDMQGSEWFNDQDAALFRQLPDLKGAKSFGESAAASSPSIEGQQETIDLMSLIDPVRDSRGDDWKKVDGGLVSKPKRRTALMIPYRPPDEYRLEFTATRLVRDNALHIGLVAEGEPVFVVIDARANNDHPVFGWASGMDKMRRSGRQILSMATPVKVQAEVRRSGGTLNVSVSVDQKQIISYRGSLSRVVTAAGYKLPTKGVFVLGTWAASIRIAELKVTPLKGSGRIIEFADPLVDPARAAAERAIWKGGAGSVLLGAGTAAAPALRVRFESRDDLLQPKAIKSIDLQGSPWFRDQDLELLAGSPDLSELDISSTNLTADALERIGRLPELRTLIASDSAIQSLPKKINERFPQLRSLDLARCPISNLADITFSSHPQLRFLNLSNTPTDNLRALEGLNKLMRLDLSFTRISDQGLAGFPRLPKLRELDLAGTMVRSLHVLPADRLPSLASIKVPERAASKDSVNSLRENFPSATVYPVSEPGDGSTPWLADRHITLSTIARGGIAYVESANSRPYNHWWDMLTGGDMLPFYRFKITKLSLLGPQFTDADLVEVARLVKLQELQVAGTRISIERLARLSAPKTLNKITLAEDEFTSEQLQWLRRRLPGIEIVGTDVVETAMP